MPAIVSWPGFIAPGSVSDEYFSTVDYLPTISAIAGINEIPEGVDGVNITSLFLEPGKKHHSERSLFWHYPHFSNQLGRPAGAVRAGDFKLVELYESGRLELYDLKNDVSESSDISKKNKGKTQELHKLLSDWLQDMNARMPLPNPDYKQR